MFEKFTDKIASKVKETAKEEITTTVDAQIPFVLGIIAIGITIASFMQTKKVKIPDAKSIIIINNYYYG